MGNIEEERFDPAGTFGYLRKAVKILFLDRPTMNEMAKDPHALRVGLPLAAFGGAITVLPNADITIFIFFGIYAVVSLYLFAGFIHLLGGYTKGKEQFLGLVRITALASIIDWMAAVPILALGVTIWGIAVAVVATEEIYGVTKGKAILYVLAAVAALWIVTLLLLNGPFVALHETHGA